MNTVNIDMSWFSKQRMWSIATKAAGAYNAGNNGKPADDTYSGEHPYSGSYIYLGYWGEKILLIEKNKIL